MAMFGGGVPNGSAWNRSDMVAPARVVPVGSVERRQVGEMVGLDDGVRKLNQFCWIDRFGLGPGHGIVSWLWNSVLRRGSLEPCQFNSSTRTAAQELRTFPPREVDLSLFMEGP